MESDLGRAMLGFALQEIELARDGLESVDPTDWKKITELQQRARFGSSFRQWLEELLQKGNEAISQWRQNNAEM